jgi:4'-phosphopantetheinyl transferase
MLNQTPSQILDFYQSLGPDEQERAARFHFEQDRKHFIVARGVLRAILGRYLNRSPECLSFCYSSYGKPALAGESELNTIRFNLSHSYGVALCAVTRGRDVGIDLERIRCGLAGAQIAGRFFSPKEIAMLQAFPAEMQNQAFFRCWTSKEAYIKALGKGLSLPLDQFDVSLDPREPGIVVDTSRDPSEASRWSLQELTPAPGYAAAIAVEGHDWRLTCWQWPDPMQPSV